jgi:hypothetical protein
MVSYMSEIISPYLTFTKTKLNLQQDQKCIILDCWSVHKSARFRQYIQDNHKDICLLYVPAGCTGKFQVTDLIVNNPLKAVVRSQSSTFLSNQVLSQLDKGTAPSDIRVDLTLSTLKPRLIQWVGAAYRQMKKDRELVHEGWQKAQLLRA